MDVRGVLIGIYRKLSIRLNFRLHSIDRFLTGVLIHNSFACLRKCGNSEQRNSKTFFEETKHAKGSLSTNHIDLYIQITQRLEVTFVCNEYRFCIYTNDERFWPHRIRWVQNQRVLHLFTSLKTCPTTSDCIADRESQPLANLTDPPAKARIFGGFFSPLKLLS